VKAFCRAVDFANDWAGRGVAVLFTPLVLILMIEVVLRYFFNSPTIWAWDVDIQLAALIIVLGGGYTLLKGAHVHVDIVVQRLSPRVRAILGLLSSPVFLFALGVLLWHAIREAGGSVLAGERTGSLLNPPIYPLKIVICVGIFLFLLQVIAKFIRDLNIASRSGKNAAL